MANALGRIPVKIGASVAPAVRNFTSSRSQAQKDHVFADGSRARSEGQPRYKFNMTCSLLSDRQTHLDLIEAARAQGEVNISYEVGGREYMLVDCGIDTEDMTSDSDGTADLTISGIALDRIQVR